MKRNSSNAHCSRSESGKVALGSRATLPLINDTFLVAFPLASPWADIFCSEATAYAIGVWLSNPERKSPQGGLQVKPFCSWTATQFSH